MKAIVYTEYGPPEVLTYSDIEKPVPGDNEILIRVRAASINSWDWDMIRGKPFLVRMWGLSRPKYHIPGADVSGTVEAVGRNVARFTPGDEVFGDLSNCGWGGCAEYVCAPEDAVVPKPRDISFGDAAAMPQAGVMALQSLREVCAIAPGDKVLINGGAGAVGTIAIQLAKRLGADVTAVDATAKLGLMKSLGADRVIDYTKQDFTRQGNRYDLIIDPVAHHSMFDYHRALRPGGYYVMIGGAVSRMLQFLLVAPWLSRIGTKQLRILGHKVNKNLTELGEMVSSGFLKPAIDRTYDLKNTSEAFRYYASGQVQGKIIITTDTEG